MDFRGILTASVATGNSKVVHNALINISQNDIHHVTIAASKLKFKMDSWDIMIMWWILTI